MIEGIVIVILVVTLVAIWVSSCYDKYYLGRITFKEYRYVSYEVGRKNFFHVLVKNDETYTTEKIEVDSDCYERFNVGDNFGVKL